MLLWMRSRSLLSIFLVFVQFYGSNDSFIKEFEFSVSLYHSEYRHIPISTSMLNNLS